MILQRKARTVHAVNCNVEKRGGEQHFLFISDIHYDSTKCDRDRLHRHLEEARDLGAGVFIFGDPLGINQSAGAGLIAAGGLMLVWFDRKKKGAAPK